MFNPLAFNDKSPSPLLQVLFDELTAKWSKKLGISGLYNITAQKSFPVKFWCVDHPQWGEKKRKGHSYFHKTATYFITFLVQVKMFMKYKS